MTTRTIQTQDLQVIDALVALGWTPPGAKPADNWIPISERLPDLSKHNVVLCACQDGNGHVFSAEYIRDIYANSPAKREPHWRWRGGRIEWDIKFWQPLPAARVVS